MDVNTCGGCPGKKAVPQSEEMVSRWVDASVLASCITKGNPIGFPCPNAETMRKAIAKRLGDKVKVIDHTH